MERQATFADIQSAGRRRATKRDLFLREMDEAIPLGRARERRDAIAGRAARAAGSVADVGGAAPENAPRPRRGIHGVG